MKHNEIIENLKSSRNLSNRYETVNFYKAIDALEHNPQPDLIEEMFLVFTDDVDEFHGLQSLQTHIESYPADIFILALTRTTRQLSVQAPEWLDLFYLSILNNDEDVPQLKKHYSQMNSTLQNLVRNALIDLRVKINDLNDEVWRQKIRDRIDSVIRF